LSGASPFRGDSPASTMMRILSSEPAPLISVPGVSPELSSAVSRLLQKRPEDRLESAERVIGSLESRSTVTVVPKPWVVRRWGLFLAALLGLAIASAGVAFWPRVRSMIREAQPRPIGSRPIVAVLGFKNDSRRDDAAWLSTALSELMTRELAAG